MNGITLVGFSGAGKSSIGRRVANTLGLKFVDLDIHIAKEEEKSHQEILSELGSEKLKELELHHTRTLPFENTLFAPGGSIIYSPEAIKKIKRETAVIHLNHSPKSIKKRVGKTLHERGIVGLKERGLKALMKEREPLYQNAAHHVIYCDGISDEMIHDAIVNIYEVLQHKK